MNIPFGDDELYRLARRDARRDERRDAAAEKLAQKRKEERPYLTKSTGQRRKHLINEVMDMLRDWRFTPLENEAPAIYNLRSALCEGGMAWGTANSEASELVAASFRLLGVKRPSWDEGQLHYAAPQENCSWCWGSLDDEEVARGRRFCAPECAKASLVYRDFETGYQNSTIGMAAYQIVQRSRNPKISCQHCGYQFRPRFVGAAHANRFCSETCAHEASRTLKPIVCANPACAKTFRPAHAMKRYCSMTCRNEAPRALLPHKCETCAKDFQSSALNARFCCLPCKRRASEMAKAANEGRRYRPVELRPTWCRCCGSTFETMWPKAHYCSANCRQLVSDMKSGRNIPKRISPRVFDYVFNMAA